MIGPAGAWHPPDVMRRLGFRPAHRSGSGPALAVGAPFLAAGLLLGLCGCADRLEGGELDGRSEDELVGTPCEEIDTYTICDDGLVINMTVSIGVCLPETREALDLDALLADADRRLYVAKREGRDRVVFAD